MLILILASIAILVLGLSIFLGNYIYYRIYPERKSVESYAHSTPPTEIINGDPGIPGASGVDNEKAVDGLFGPRGERGQDGVSGQKSTIVGATGSMGTNGMSGPAGVYGISGSPGLPSNSSIPAVIQCYDQTYRITPMDIEHTFTLNNELYKLNVIFIPDDISCFQFPPNDENQRYQIDSSDNSWIEVTGGKAKKVYGQFKVALETAAGEDADGKLFYVSPPINRDGYLIVLDKEPDSSSFLVADGLLEEKNVMTKKTFGLDFNIIDISPDDHKYNYFLKGLFGYKVIVNIDPPIPTVFPRLVETTSSRRMGDIFLPALKFSAKSGDSKFVSKNNIMMISPRFESGLIVIKDSADTGSLWKQTKYTNFNTFFLEESPNKMVGAFKYLEEEANSFNEDSDNGTSSNIYALSSINSIVFATQNNVNEPLAEAENAKMAFFLTYGSIKNMKLTYSTNEFPLTIPLIMDQKKFYISFVISIPISGLNNFIYNVSTDKGPRNYKSGNMPLKIFTDMSTLHYDDDDTTTVWKKIFPTKERFFSDLLFGKKSNLVSNITINKKDGIIYLPFTINIDNIPFSSLYGRRVCINLGNTIDVFFNAFYPTPSAINSMGALATAIFKDGNFLGYNISYDTSSFNFVGSSSNFDIYSNMCRVGYNENENERNTQCVPASLDDNKNLIIDLPLFGYFKQEGPADANITFSTQTLLYWMYEGHDGVHPTSPYGKTPATGKFRSFSFSYDTGAHTSHLYTGLQFNPVSYNGVSMEADYYQKYLNKSMIISRHKITDYSIVASLLFTFDNTVFGKYTYFKDVGYGQISRANRNRSSSSELDYLWKFFTSGYVYSITPQNFSAVYS